jgi:hypothetical protein
LAGTAFLPPTRLSRPGLCRKSEALCVKTKNPAGWLSWRGSRILSDHLPGRRLTRWNPRLWAASSRADWRRPSSRCTNTRIGVRPAIARLRMVCLSAVWLGCTSWRGAYMPPPTARSTPRGEKL